LLFNPESRSSIRNSASLISDAWQEGCRATSFAFVDQRRRVRGGVAKGKLMFARLHDSPVAGRIDALDTISVRLTM
jgi:hypothetical protein